MTSISSSGFSNSLWTSASGLLDASLRVDNVAHNVANMNTEGFEPDRIVSQALPNGSGVASRVERGTLKETFPEAIFSNTDLANEMTNMVMAKRAYQANAKVLSATDDTWKELFQDI